MIYKGSRIAKEIIEETNRENYFKEFIKRKDQENKNRVKNFIINNCKNCKNKETNHCYITKDITNKLTCVYYEKIDSINSTK